MSVSLSKQLTQTKAALAAANAKLAQQKTAEQQAASLGLTTGQLNTAGVNPGISTGMSTGTYPIEAGTGAGMLPGALQTLDTKPQVNANNQSALATNGSTVNQSVTNDNTYHNNYYQLSNGYDGVYGSYYGNEALYGRPPFGGYWRSGFVGWLQRLFA